MGLAVAVFGIAAVLDTIVHVAIDDGITTGWGEALAVIVSGPLSVTSAALVFYAGLLDRLVGHHLFGHSKPSLPHTLRTLPWMRLLAADAVFVTAASAGWAAGIVPGLIVFTYWSLIGPVVNIEGDRVLPSLKRTASLAGRKFWLVLVLVTLPAIFENLLLHGFHFVGAARPLFAAFTVSALIGVTAGAFIGVVEVTLAHALISAHPKPHQDLEPP